MNKNFTMLSGIPRSGSQVLASLLNQHPDIFASTTSPVVDLLDIVNKNWNNLSAALIAPHPQQYKNIVEGVIDGAYKHIDKSVIVDKNRIWPRYGRLMSEVLGVRPKIICTVRPIPEVLSSYILLLNKNAHKITFVDQDLIDLKLPINTKNRCKILWEKYIYQPYTSLRIGRSDQEADLLFLEYDDIVNNSQQVMHKVSAFIGIKSHTISTDNMQLMPENDSYHGGLNGLHDVRPIMSRTSPPPEEVIGHELTQLYTNMRLDFWNQLPPIAKARPTTNNKHVIESAPVEDSLPGDSLDYDLLYRASEAVSFVPGLICEIGVRRGGSLRHIIDGQPRNKFRTIVAIDPYGNIEYAATEQFKGRLDYTNSMKNESLPNIYNYVQGKNINLIFFNLEDTEFFDKYAAGVPVYAETKEIVNEYALVFFDGPHDVRSIKLEVDFFIDRTVKQGVFIFDDVSSYPHDIIHSYLLTHGFELLEIGKQQRKISYRKIA